MSTRRWTTIAIAAMTVLLAAGCQPWTQFMGNPGLNGNDAGETFIGPSNVTSLQQAYTIALPAGSRVVLSPVTSGGDVFAGTDKGQLVVASNGTTNCSGSPKVCQPLWTATFPNTDTASPPVVAGGMVYEAFSNSSTGFGSLAAYDVNGSTNCSGTPKTCLPLWTAPATSVAGPNVDGGRVFVDDLQTQQLEVFDAAGVTGCSGAPTRTCLAEWTAPIHSWAVPSIANGRVYVPTFDTTPAYVAAYDEAGSTNCTGSPVACAPLFTVPLPESTTGSVDVSDGVGYVETETSWPTNSQLVAFDANGVIGCSGSPLVCQPEWTAVLSGAAHFSTPAVANGRVYAASTATWGVLDQFDAAGVTGCSGTPTVCTRLVTTPSTSSTNSFASPIVTNGLVVEKGVVYPTATSGCSGGTPIVCSPLWTAPVTPYISGSVISSATLLVAGSDSFIHAYQLTAS